MRVLVTGGAGFIGHHLVAHILEQTDWSVVVIDKLGYASTWERLRAVNGYEGPRVRSLCVDLANAVSEGVKHEIGEIDAIIHLGAETHVDNSIVDPLSFIDANVTGTHHALQLARDLDARFFYFSTDEVFGPADINVAFKEDDRHNPGNPYAATKSAGEMLVKSYANTYGVKATITRCMNVFGERQHAEKFIPLVVKKVLAGDKVIIHGDLSRTISGSRFYTHATNVADAYLHIMGKPDDTWHIVGDREVSNLQLARQIAECVGKPLRYEIVNFHSTRPGYDFRYCLDGSKLAASGWKAPMGFDDSLHKTVQWFLDNPRWLQ